MSSEKVSGKDTNMAGTALVKQETQIQPPTAAPTPMTMLQIAVEQNWDLDKLSKLMDLQDRWQATEARKAFDAALAKFKANPPELFKNKEVKYGTTHYKHATLDEVASKIGEAMAPCGLSFRWNVQQEGARIRVTCILSHVAGHSESVQLEAPPDNSGQKNSIQQVGSTITYLQRYSLLAATGMAVQDESDNDGSSLPSAEETAMLKSISGATTMDILATAYRAAYRKAQESKNKEFMAQVIATKDARRAELSTPAAAPEQPATPEPPTLISAAQLKRFHTIVSKQNCSHEDAKNVLSHFGYASSKDITTTDYDALVTLFEGGEWVNYVNIPAGKPLAITGDDEAF